MSGLAGAATFSATNLGPAFGIAVVSGSGQSAYLNAAYAQPLVFEVTDTSGARLPGVQVTMSGPGSGATAAVDNITVTTGTDGRGLVTATANGKIGSYNLTANVAGVTTPAAFALTNIYDPAFAPATISIVDGNNQRPKISTAFATPLKVKVVDGSNRAGYCCVSAFRTGRPHGWSVVVVRGVARREAPGTGARGAGGFSAVMRDRQ